MGSERDGMAFFGYVRFPSNRHGLCALYWISIGNGVLYIYRQLCNGMVL